MKKLLIIIAVFLLSFSLSFAQYSKAKVNKEVIKSEIVSLQDSQVIRNASMVEIADPTVFTSEASFVAALGGDYFLDNFDDMNNGSTSAVFSIERSSRDYSCNVSSKSTDELYELLGAISVSTVQSIYITNTGKEICAFGGYFYNVNFDDLFASSDVNFTLGTYTYTYYTASRMSFVGFIFSSSFTEIEIDANDGNELFPSISRLYLSATSTALDREAISDVVLYPNPAIEGVSINKKGTVEIYNAVGQVVLRTEVDHSYISLCAMPKGIYLLRIMTDKGVFHDKLIKK